MEPVAGFSHCPAVGSLYPTRSPKAANGRFPYRHRNQEQVGRGVRCCPSCSAMTAYACSWPGCPMVTDPVDQKRRKWWLRQHHAPARQSHVADFIAKAMQHEVEDIET